MTKVIVQCDKCKHQYSLHEKRVGEKFSCFCGTLLTVPSVKIHDAAVVRCSSCGGSRGKDQEPFCRYCGSSFTIHERDLNTICPHCMTRISSKAKFCHSCATPIVADSDDFLKTELPCPNCDDEKLHSRKMQSNTFTLKECSHCAGLWISADAFRHLERRTQQEIASGVQSASAEVTAKNSKQFTGNPEKFYRKCPQCTVIMHRRNYAGSSGIIVDVCKDHGLWFDIHELDEVLEFIRSGELIKHQQRAVRKAKLDMRKTRSAPPSKSSVGDSVYDISTRTDVLSEVIRWLID